MRSPTDIIGRDALTQLAFEGYEVVLAKTLLGFPVVESQSMASGCIQFRGSDGQHDLII